LPGAFNPPTKAHVALAHAALEIADSVLLVLPKTLPHKDYAGAPFSSRVEMIRRVASSDRRLGAAVSEGGLFVDIARELRGIWPQAEVHFICGRDAAERIVGWDYGGFDSIERMLEEFQLFVAPRGGGYAPPPHLEKYIRRLQAPEHDTCSSTTVRELIERGDPRWIDFVPGEIADLVLRFYSPRD
jgi:nicotinic acid mononucleotide adenylyltransferase